MGIGVNDKLPMADNHHFIGLDDLLQEDLDWLNVVNLTALLSTLQKQLKKHMAR